MTKRTVFSTISPLPAGVSREVVLDFLHNHTEMIDLNPLVIERHFIKPPRNVDPEEKDCTWYSMTDKIDYLPGGKVSGDISYTCAFHDLPNGIQTHCRAPLGVDIRDKWTLNGSLPWEPPEPAELGIGAPASGLYIREDVDLRCNILMTRFVKKNLKSSHAALVDKLVEKARELSAQGLSSSGVAQGISRPWSPPTHSSTQIHQRQGSNKGSCTTSPNFVQEARSPTTQIDSPNVGAHQPNQDPTIRYSQARPYQVSSPYRAPSQHSSHAQVCSSEYPPALRMPSQRKFQEQTRYEHPPPVIHPPRPQEHLSTQALLPYPDDEDYFPAPLRIGGPHQGVNAASSSYTSASRSRSSSDLEHPMYPHLSPYSPVFTERSSSPDDHEPRTPESIGHGEPKRFVGKMDHPDVLRPGNGRPNGKSNGLFRFDLD